MKNDGIRQFWERYAQAFVHPLCSNHLLGNFVNETNVTGAYAEAWVRWLVSSMLQKYKVSTGAVVRPADGIRGRKPLQCDLILWDPTELPSLFEVGGFALVPSFSVRGLIEVKRSAKGRQEIQKQLAERREAMPLAQQRYVLGVVVQHREPLFDLEVHPDWVRSTEPEEAPRVTRLLDADGRPDTDGIFALIYMLSNLAGHTGVLGANDVSNDT